MGAGVHTKDIDEALLWLGVNISLGLTSEQVDERLAEHGPNEISDRSHKSFIVKILDQFKDLLVIVFIAAIIISVILSDGEGFERFSEAIIIFCILLLKMIIDASQENRADRALRKLKSAASPKVKVKRDGEILTIDSYDLVIGDVILLETGDLIPADIRLIETVNMRVDEFSITSASSPTKKQANVILEEETSLDERRNIAYAGSVITYGRGAGVVFAVADNTEAGKSKKFRNKQDDVRVSQQDNLKSSSKSFGILCVCACALVFLVSFLYNIIGFGDSRNLVSMILISVSLAVAAFPRGMGITATTILSVGAQKMMRSNVLVKKLKAIEALGNTTVVCADKTGTFTQNIMTVALVADFENTFEVTGAGYRAKGVVVSDGIVSRNIALMAEIAVLCNDAIFDKRSEKIIGDPTEGAMLVLGAKLGQEKAVLNAINPRIHEIPFDSTRKMMSTYNMYSGKVTMNTKGAPETIINRSSGIYLDGEIVPMSDSIKQRLLAKNEEFASKGLRVLAFAYKEYDSPNAIDNVEDNLIYVGLMCLTDPLREGVADSIEKCRAAGVNIKMVTGDQKLTAMAVALSLGLIKDDDEVFDCCELSGMSNETLAERVQTSNVFFGASPENRVRIVAALKEGKNTVELIGGGLSDSPALKAADVGISKRLMGTDVAEEVADIVLIDDSFFSFTNAAMQARKIYSNIRKTVGYTLSCNFGLILLVLIATLFGLPLPLAAAQILFISLLTNSLPAFALSAEKIESGVLRRKPGVSTVGIINKSTRSSVIARALFISLGALVAYLYGFFIATAPNDNQHAVAMSMCFFTLVLSGIFIAFPSKSEDFIGTGKSVFGNKLLNISLLLLLIILLTVLYVPILSSMFSLIPLGVGELILCFVIVLITVGGFVVSKRSA